MKILLSVWKVDGWINKKKRSKKKGQWPESFLIRIVKSDTDQKLERDKLSSTEQKFSESETSLVPTLSSKTFVQKSGFVEKGDTNPR